MLTWEMSNRLIFERGLYPPISSEYESPRLQEIVEQLHTLNLEMMKLQDEVRDKSKKSMIKGFSEHD